MESCHGELYCMILDTTCSRILLLLGEEKTKRLQQLHVLIVGLGAVGSFAIEALARTGIGHLHLVDFDHIKPSNINRQLYALQTTIGLQKIDVAKERIAQINPCIQVYTQSLFCDKETADPLFETHYDYVIDAIDSVNPKVALIAAAMKHNVPLISSMGTAGRMDPTQLQCTDITEVRGCTLSRHVRKKLHKQGIRTGFQAVWSTEPFQQTLQNSDPEMKDFQEQEFFQKGRPRAPLPTLIFVPASAGLLLASRVVQHFLEE